MSLLHPSSHLRGFLPVLLVIDLCDPGRAAAQDDPGGFQAELFTQEFGGILRNKIQMATNSAIEWMETTQDPVATD